MKKAAIILGILIATAAILFYGVKVYVRWKSDPVARLQQYTWVWIDYLSEPPFAETKLTKAQVDSIAQLLHGHLIKVKPTSLLNYGPEPLITGEIDIRNRGIRLPTHFYLRGTVDLWVGNWKTTDLKIIMSVYNTLGRKPPTEPVQPTTIRPHPTAGRG